MKYFIPELDGLSQPTPTLQPHRSMDQLSRVVLDLDTQDYLKIYMGKLTQASVFKGSISIPGRIV